MEPREEPRFETDQEVTVTLLGETDKVLPGRIVNFSGRGMCLLSSQPLPAGGALKIECSDTLVLGEVAYCRGKAGEYKIGIRLHQALYHTRNLAALAERLRLNHGGRPRAYDSEVTPL